MSDDKKIKVTMGGQEAPDGIIHKLRDMAKERGLEKEFAADPEGTMVKMMSPDRILSNTRRLSSVDYYYDLNSLTASIDAFRQYEPEEFFKIGSKGIRVQAWVDHYERHGLMNSIEMENPSYGFNQIINFNLALQEIIDQFPRPESGQIIATLYHVIAFCTVSALCTHRNVPIPIRAIYKVLNMNAPTSNRTLTVLSDGSLNAVTARYDAARERMIASDAEVILRKNELRVQGIKAEIRGYKDKLGKDTTVSVEGVKADGTVGMIEVNPHILGENRLGLIKKMIPEEFKNDPKAGHLQLTEKGLMLADRIKEILDAKAKWAGKQSEE